MAICRLTNTYWITWPELKHDDTSKNRYYRQIGRPVLSFLKIKYKQQLQNYT